ncbi:MAG: hypothetical protein RL497_1884 [Pseudomonadota bacterium]|jgi:hypothetical protein
MVKLFVEGGGDNNPSLATACRKGFTKFITQAGICNRPKVIACGSRITAFKDYCTAIKKGELALLLVDSEAPIDDKLEQGAPETWQPWVHLKQRQGDEWTKPENAENIDCHLMVQCMEHWILADPKTLEKFYGKDFNKHRLPSTTPHEKIDKSAVELGLKMATKDTAKGEYNKGKHSFELLAGIDPELVLAKSDWAKRFVTELKKRMDGQ